MILDLDNYFFGVKILFFSVLIFMLVKILEFRPLPYSLYFQSSESEITGNKYNDNFILSVQGDFYVYIMFMLKAYIHFGNFSFIILLDVIKPCTV